MKKKHARCKLERLFPDLARIGYAIKSRTTKRYNCIAWAAGDTTRRWDPSNMPKRISGFYWPEEASGYFGVDDLASVFGLLGYEKCAGGTLEFGSEKVALYEDSDPDLGWAHAARQLPDGRWTSKIGELWDIIHNTPEAVIGSGYGRIVCYMRRKIESPVAVSPMAQQETDGKGKS